MITLINDDCRNLINKIRNENCIIVADAPFHIEYHYNSFKDKMNDSNFHNQALSNAEESLEDLILSLTGENYNVIISTNS